MTDNLTTELQTLSKLKLAGRLRYWRGTIEIPEIELHAICDEIQAEHEQAIAATLGSGICKDVSEDPDLFNCSECGVLLDIASTSKTDDDKWLYKPSFCPNCGKAVKR